MYFPIACIVWKSYGVPPTLTKYGFSGIWLRLTGWYCELLSASNWSYTSPEASPPRLKYVWLVRLTTVESLLDRLVAE